MLQIHCHGTPMAATPVTRYGAGIMDRWAERVCVVVAELGPVPVGDQTRILR